MRKPTRPAPAPPAATLPATLLVAPPAATLPVAALPALPALVVLLVLVTLVAGCGVRPSGVTGAGRAPTGVAAGVTLYFVDAHGRLRPERRDTGRLGTITEALALLLDGPAGSNMSTQIGSAGISRVEVQTAPDRIRLRVPLAIYEVTPLGIDQIVCTALGVWVQSGGARTTEVRVQFTTDTADSRKWRTCPLIG